MPSSCQHCGFPLSDDYLTCPFCAMNDMIICSFCHNRVNRDQAHYNILTNECYCQSCYENLYHECNRCGHAILKADARHVDDEIYCDVCFRRLFIYCYYCNEVVDRCDAYSDPSGNKCCNTCFTRRFAVCEGCNETFDRDELHRTSHGWYCDDCRGPRGEWDETDFFCANPTYDLISSTRKYGIELETYQCPDYHILQDDTIFGCKSDPSIEGKEFVSPILYGDQGLAEIAKFCREARRLHWRVNRYCGYHVHLDVSNETWESLKKIAYAYYLTYQLWGRFVSDNRVHNNFCGAPDYTHTDILGICSQEDWDYFVGQRDRFEYVNWRSYFAHGSVEIRSHDATLNEAEVCNWIKVHVKFIDAVKDMTIDEIALNFGNSIEMDFSNFINLVGTELAEYYAGVSENWGKPILRQTVAVGSPPF